MVSTWGIPSGAMQSLGKVSREIGHWPGMEGLCRPVCGLERTCMG